MQTVAGRREESSPWLPVTTTQWQVSTEGNLCHPFVLTLAQQEKDVELIWEIVTMHHVYIVIVHTVYTVVSDICFPPVHGVHECNEKNYKNKDISLLVWNSNTGSGECEM